MIYTLQHVRDNLRTREGKRVFILGQGDHLTQEAKDWLNRERISILSGQQAKLESYRLLTGGTVTQKPEHMTHLHSDVLVPKTHPRIRFRGAVDTLEAELLLCFLQGSWQTELRELLDYTRKLLRWEVLEEPVEELCLLGMGEQTLREHSHFPQRYYGIPHFSPQPEDGAVLLQLNRARCAARTAELMGVEAFSDADGIPTRPELLKALNRLSSALYILMLRQKARQTGA